MFFSGICTGKEGNAVKDAPPRHIGMLRSNMPMDTALQVFAGAHRHVAKQYADGHSVAENYLTLVEKCDCRKKKNMV